MHLIIFIWGFTGILGKLILLDAVVIVWFRVIIAFIALGIYMIARGGSFKTKYKGSLLHLIIVGMFVAVHWLTFYQSIQLSTASLGILCLSTTTLHVAWLEPLVFKKKINPAELVLSLIVVFGIYITTSGFSHNEFVALIYGLVSAFFAALFAVFNTKIVEREPANVMTFYEMISAAISVSIFLILLGKFNSELFVMTQSDFLWLIFLGVVCTSFAFLATIVVMKHLGAFTVSLSINLEPIYTLVLAVFILNEDELLSNRFYFGAVIIVLTVLANGLMKGRKRKNFAEQLK
ncbi:MAG: EamA family transporter [Fluviicola sp.]|nr:EamA family transporter [Fluviicola sp.]